MTTEIVVLGGGYTGVWSARRLARAIGSGRLRDARVTLVSSSVEHSFHGWTAEVITGHVRPERARVPLARLLPHVRLVHGAAQGIDLQRRIVEVATDAGPCRLAYDHVVIGVGSRDAVERVPGLAEHGWSLKEPAGLAALTAHLSEAVARAAATTDPAERTRLLTVVVAGGGFTGVEAASAIVQRLSAATDAHPLLGGTRARVVLAHSGLQALPGLRPRFSRIADYAAAQARRAGVEFRDSTRLIRVDEEGAQLTSIGFVPSATVVTTIGQTPVALPGTEQLARDASGRLVTDRFLRVATGVWAGGDAAAVPHPSGKGSCPANALWAIYHGRRIGSNIARVLGGRHPSPFRFPGLGQGASIGVGLGAAELYGVQLTGWPAWLARWIFFHWFMPSHRVALQTAAEWFRRPVGHAVPPAQPSARPHVVPV